MTLFEFLDSSYTSFHTVANVCKLLEENKFKELRLGEKWQLKVGGNYYVTQNGSSVIAFKVGANKVFNICVSHTDSPSFKVKSVLPSAGETCRLNTEKYGGALLYTFFDRPLKVAGRLLVETENGVKQTLVASKYNVVIPSLAIHHNPTVNDGFAVNAQNDTLPLFSLNEKDLYATLTEEKVLDADLFVVPDSGAFFSGVNNEFVCSPRLDNLTSVWCSVNALIESCAKDVSLVCCLDNEEIGSGTRQGNPTFIANVLSAIRNSLKWSEEEYVAAVRNGMALSVDNGHAVHPAHPEKSDPVVQAKLGGGVVIKHHPNYATDGLSSAVFKRLMQMGEVPCQDYFNRSDVRCGSTLGLVTSRIVQIMTCDIGLPQLAMHSACETVCASDITAMEIALTMFLSARFEKSGNEVNITL